MNTKMELLIRLSLIEGVGAVTIARLNAIGLELLVQVNCTSAELRKHYGISHAMATRIIQGLSNYSAYEREIERAHTSNVRIITLACDEYPVLLRHLDAPPPVLYIQGAVASLSQSMMIAVVGSRDADRYAKEALELLIPPLVQSNCSIVSGGARGVDSFAHATTAAAGGTTIVVLGSGLLRPYPRENTRLFSTVVDAGGAVISAFPLTTQARPGHFPVRNRIIAGLSHACVVVQAALKSGALITAHHALELGREVLAVPGPITNHRFEGCHTLLKNGAGLVHVAEDIVQALGSELYVKSGSTSGEVLSLISEHPIAGALKVGPQHVSQLSQMIGLSESKLEQELFDLQLSGRVQQAPDGRWLLS